jgi:hypothetical protein
VPDGKKEPANSTEVGLSIAVRNVLEHPKTGQPYLEVMYQDHTVSVFTFLTGLALAPWASQGQVGLLGTLASVLWYDKLYKFRCKTS